MKGINTNDDVDMNRRLHPVKFNSSPSSNKEIMHYEEKDASEKGFSEQVEVDSSNGEENNDDELKQTGFMRNRVGNMMIIYMGIISLFWIVILLLLSLDYYGYVGTK